MKASWLHVSDFHFKSGDPYDRDVVLRALVRSVQEFRERGRRPDLIFATGDVAHSGQESEYQAAGAFFDALLAAAGVDKRRLYVIPGNHDVDRRLGVGLARTLATREEADEYFGPSVPKVHIAQKQRAFRRWHDQYFAGIRVFSETSTCGPAEAVDVRGCKIGVLPVNSALFCQGDDDHARLWIGRRCLEAAVEELSQLGAELRIALVHHPLDWLHDAERSNIKAKLQANVDLVLRGHLHETDVESVVGVAGEALHMAAGAAYQTRKWPNRALYGAVEGGEVQVFPIRYEDQPRELWTVDPSVFPSAPGYTQGFAVPRLAKEAAAPVPPPPAPAPEPRHPQRFRSNIPSRLNLPFVGRDDLLEKIRDGFGDLRREAVVVLCGQPGVGKSELAREFARRQRDGYPGGTFIVEAGKRAIVVDLARIGATLLGLDVPAGMPLEDQCLRTLSALGAEPSLLIYDNVQAKDAVVPWLPPAGMPCHVLMTTTLDLWAAGWLAVKVPPLSPQESVDLVGRVAGDEIAGRYGARLAQLADGLPVQIVPASVTLAYEARRGRLDAASLTLTREAQESFLGVYQQLEAPVQLLLHAAARLNPQRIPREELQRHLEEAAGWSAGEFQRRVDACLDLHLLQDGVELRMHQLFAAFVLGRPVPEEVAKLLQPVVRVQARRMMEVARELAAHPDRADLAAKLMAYSPDAKRWGDQDAEVSVEEGETLGRALLEIGEHEAARPWHERAVAAKEKGDVHGRVDHDSLGRSVRAVAGCLRQLGRLEEAAAWDARAAGLGP